MRRYVPALVLGAATVGSTVFLLSVGGLLDTAIVLVPLVTAAVGAPVTAMLLAVAVSRSREPTRSLGPSFLLGFTVVPILVLLLAGVTAAIAYALIVPLAEVAGDLLESLRADPTLVEVFSSPWWFFFLVELAVVAPLGEESLKPLGSILRRPRSRTEAFMFGVAAGAGFAAVEDLLYASAAMGADAWLGVAVLRWSGAALHLLGAGLVSLGVYEVRSRKAGLSALAKLYGAAVGIHALWNGSIAVAIILFSEQAVVGGGLSGTALSWGIALMVFLATLGAVLLGGLVLTARWVGSSDSSVALLQTLRFDQPRAVAAWASIAASLLVPVAIVALAFPGFLSL